VKKLAVVNCKSLKKDASTKARDMYDKSAQFRAQKALFEQAYDWWVILSAKHGVVFPDQVIEPYNLSMYNNAQRLKNVRSLTKEEKQKWVLKVIQHPVWEKYDEIHFHVSKAYWDPIKHAFPQAVWVRQQVNPGLVVVRYQEALHKYQQEGILDFSILSEHKPSSDPEKAKKWYHPVHGSFFGYARDVSKAFGVDEGNLHRVSRGKTKQTRGWVVDPLYLDKLEYNDKRGQWKITRE